MRNPVEEYQAVKTRFIHGNRYAVEPELARWGRAAGMTADEIIADVRENDPSGEHDDGIRRMWEGTTFRPSDERSPYSYRPRTSYAPRMARQTFPGYVRGLIRDGDGTADFDALRALSPISLSSLQSPQAQTAAFLAALYEPADLLFVFPNIKNRHPRGEIGRNILTRDEWLERLRRTGNLGGDCINKNPLTGRQGTSGKGEPSFTSRDCIAAYRYALIEFDHLTLQEQAAFWLGWLSDPKRAATLAALTFSGGKSLHGLIRTGADTITAPTVQRNLSDLLCADPENQIVNGKTVYPFRADPNTLRPDGGTRLSGAVRRDNGNRQQLLYLSVLNATSTPSQDVREVTSTRPVPQTGNHAPETKERATVAEIGVPAHISTDRLLARDSVAFDLVPLPQEPDGDAPLDELLAYNEVLEHGVNQRARARVTLDVCEGGALTPPRSTQLL